MLIEFFQNYIHNVIEQETKKTLKTQNGESNGEKEVYFKKRFRLANR